MKLLKVESRLFACLAVLVIAGCSLPSPPISPVSGKLAPAALPEREVSYALKVASNDGVYSTDQRRIPRGVRNEVSSGCFWDVEDVYGPVTLWGGCDDADGRQDIIEEEGALWPLQVGAKKSWRLAGKNADGETWRVWQECAVTSEHLVRIGAEDIETFRVRCDDPHVMRVYFHSPRLGHHVYYQSVRSGPVGDSDTRWETEARVLEGGAMEVEFLPTRLLNEMFDK